MAIIKQLVTSYKRYQKRRAKERLWKVYFKSGGAIR